MAVGGCGRGRFALIDSGEGSVDSRATDGAAQDAGPQPNVVFVSSTALSGDFGVSGGALANADAVCAADAASAGVSGTFVAWISTTTVDAIDRLTGSRGWTRVDGTPVLDQPDGIVTGQMLDAIATEANGTRPATGGDLWTGTWRSGRAISDPCSNWTTLSGAQYAIVGDADDAGFTWHGASISCNSSHRIACFEVGRAVAVAVTPAPRGRIAFLSTPVTPDAGLAGFDLRCRNEASSAGLPGTYRAVTATTTASARSRFTIDARPITRVDGTVVATDSTSFFDASIKRSILNQRADGTRVGYEFPNGAGEDVWIGASTPDVAATAVTSCNNWTSIASTSIGYCGAVDSIGARFWADASPSCDFVAPLLCLQE
jgi:hypothetical protein